MTLRERMQRCIDWPGWRTHAPAAGSMAAHAVVGLAIVGLMAGSGRPIQPAPLKAPDSVLEIALMAEALPLPAAVRAPAAPRPGSPPPPKTGEPLPGAPPVVSAPLKKDQKPQQALPEISTAASSDDAGGVYLGRSPFARPAKPGGLAGLGQGDPCDVLVGPKPKDCGTNWAARVGKMDSVMPRSKEDMRQYHAEFIAPCPWKVGCEGGEWKSTNGTRSVFSSNGSPMMSGAGGLGGINEVVGRLGFNPDHTDPGFGD